MQQKFGKRKYYTEGEKQQMANIAEDINNLQKAFSKLYKSLTGYSGAD